MAVKRAMVMILSLGLIFCLGSGAVWASALSKPSPVGARAMGMGGAFVGVADDTTAIYWNPAGLTQLKGTHIEIGGESTIPGESYHPYTVTDPTGATTTKEKAKLQFLPAPTFGICTDHLKPLALGLGVYLPYANGGEFSTASQAPFNPNEGRIYGLEISPALAVQIVEGVSLGMSARIEYVKSELQGQLISPAFPAPFAGNYAGIDTSGWGAGGSVGLLLGPFHNARLGFVYRSSITTTLKGDFTLKDGAGTTLATDQASLKMVFPNIIRVGLAYDVTPKLLLASGFDWEQNSQIKNFDITLSSGLFQVPANYKDSYTFHLGGRYRLDDHWTGTMGYTYDTSSIPDESMNRINGDVNAHEIAVGGGYKYGRYGIDGAYLMRFGGRTIPLNLTATGFNPGAGEYFGYVSTLSLLAHVSFD